MIRDVEIQGQIEKVYSRFPKSLIQEDGFYYCKQVLCGGINKIINDMTKSQLNERCRRILYGSEPYKPISVEDQDWLMNNIFNHHPEKGWFDEKGVVDHIEPRHDKSRFHSLCFNIVFTNGSIYDISFHKCINNMTKKDLGQ